ncbi:MAG: PilZ domain-containing protein [Elusimicrobiota bacterium]
MNVDRRGHKRLPLTLSVAQPIRIIMMADGMDDSVPGILVNISAGGLAMITFKRIPVGSDIQLTLDFMGINERVSGKVVRQNKKFTETFIVGIKFDRQVEQMKNIIDKMAEDFDICELRYLMKGEDACFPKCSFHAFCARRIRKEFPKKGANKK